MISESPVDIQNSGIEPIWGISVKDAIDTIIAKAPIKIDLPPLKEQSKLSFNS